MTLALGGSPTVLAGPSAGCRLVALRPRLSAGLPLSPLRQSSPSRFPAPGYNPAGGRDTAARWLVIADTHWPRHGPALPGWLLAAAAQADTILHAGDLTDPALLQVLSDLAPTWAVAGNGDPGGDPRLPDRRILTLDGLRIGLTHGHLGAPGAPTPRRAAAAFRDDGVGLVVFGHSHQPLLMRAGDLWLLNPGSPTERRRAPRRSAAWLAVAGGEPLVNWLGEPAAPGT